MKTHPNIGNVVVIEQDESVKIQLITDANDGAALLTYREVAQLAKLLATVRPPETDDWRDLV